MNDVKIWTHPVSELCELYLRESPTCVLTAVDIPIYIYIYIYSFFPYLSG